MERAVACAGVLAVAACTFTAQKPAEVIDAPPATVDDAAPTADAQADAPNNQFCLGANNFRVCLDSEPMMPFEVAGTANTTIDTDDGASGCVMLPQPGGRPLLCVIAASTIQIDANILFAKGSHPLVLFAAQTIRISRGVDVGSHFSGQASGAGANSASCVAATAAGSDGNGGGGGAGGSFGTKGGNGGTGGGNNSNGSTAGATSATTDFLRGGCPGSDGGDGNAANTGGRGNEGGGAVLLLAGDSITISGFVNASGAGGVFGESSRGGGGGGGSGGMIVMSAQAITVTGQLVANGGGGAGGASQGTNGNPGTDPTTAMPLKAAGGGTGGGGGATDGAAGATRMNGPGNSPNATEGAGGAGGGLGQIRVLSGQTLGGTCSPIPLTM